MNRNHLPWLAVVAVSCLSLFMFLGSRGLSEPDEGRFAEASREMSLQSNWLMPHLAGVPHLQKPPVTFWVTAMCIKLFGVNEWAVRLPSAFAALGILLLTMHLANLLFGSTISWKAGLILLSSVLFFAIARIITTDMLLSFWITGAVVAYVHYTKRFSMTALILFYCCLGLGFLTKGPMAYLVPLAAVIPWTIACRNEPKPPGWHWHWIPGILFSAAISASWFVLLFRQYPELMNYYYQHEFIDRIASDTHHRAKPLWYYSLVMFGGLLPWSVMLPRILFHQWRQRSLRRAPAFWLISGWLIIPWLVLHLVTSKLPTYILPLFPPMALVLAHEWERFQPKWNAEIRWATALFAIGIASLPMVFWWLGKAYHESSFLQPAFILFAVIISMGWMYYFIKASSQPSDSKLFSGIGAMMLLSMLLASSQSENFLQIRGKSLTPIMEGIKNARVEYPQALLFAFNMKKFGLEFYLQEPILRTVKCVETTLPIPENLAGLYIDDPLRYLQAHQQEEYLILIPAYFLPDPMPSHWEIVQDYRNVMLVHRERGP